MMRDVTVRTAARQAAMVLMAGIGGVAGSYAVAGSTPGFVGAPVAGALSRTMPGAILTVAILVLGDLGQALSLATAIGLAVLGLGGLAIGGATAGRRLDSPAAALLLAAALPGLAALALTGAPAPSLAAGVGAGAVVLGGAALPAATRPAGAGAERRRFLGGLAVAAGAVVTGAIWGGRDRTKSGSRADARPLADADRAAATSLLAGAEDRSMDVEGLGPLVSERFYEVDINAVNPTVDPESWTLTVSGAVDREVSYGYDELRDMSAVTRHVSLRCVGEKLNGLKMDNAVWTGVPITRLLEPAGPAPTCCVMLRAADGFFEEFPLSALSDALLAYGMNGRVLPRAHGFPARALVPGHWGEINVKWLTEIEVLEEEVDGYWEERGWHGTGPVTTVAKLHVVNHLDDGRIQVAGHAYAGTRGIRRVEVSIDDGEHWMDARLSAPLPGDDVWRQWTHTYRPPDGPHQVVVRATDGTGEVQPLERRPAFPRGPAGWVSRSVDP